MSRWKRRPDTLVPFEANQALPGSMMVLGVRSREDGTYYVTTIQGRDVDVTPGDWIIQEPDGEHYYPCQDDIFRARYEGTTE